MKKTFLSFIMILVLCFVLSGCGTKSGDKAYEKHTNLVPIPCEENLYFDSNTKIVYFIFNEWTGRSGYGYMSAYYAPNGLPYLYDEIEQTLIIIEK